MIQLPDADTAQKLLFEREVWSDKELEDAIRTAEWLARFFKYDKYGISMQFHLKSIHFRAILRERGKKYGDEA